MDCPFMIAPSVFSNVYIIQVHVVKYKSKMVFVVSNFSLSLHWFLFVLLGYQIFLQFYKDKLLLCQTRLHILVVLL